MSYHGDFKLGDTLDIQFTTTKADGTPITLAGSPAVAAYIGNSTTEITSGITLTVDLDSRTGLHNVRVVATTGNTFAAATNVSLILTAGTVNSISVVGYQVGSFSIENRVVNITSMPVLTGPYAGLDIADSGTAQAISATTLQLRAASPANGTNTVAGQIVGIFGSTQGYWQYARVSSNTSAAGGTLTFPALPTTPSGTVTYVLYGAPTDSALAAAEATLLKLEAAFASSGVFSTAALANSPVGTYQRSSSITTTGTTLSGTDSTIPEVGTNRLINKTILWTGGGNNGNSCRITASVGTAFSVTPAQTAVITAGDTYKLYHDAASTLTAESLLAIVSTQLSESYAADGAVPTLAQALIQIQQFLTEASVSGTTMTVKKLDGVTTAMTFTLNSAYPVQLPTSITRST